MCGIIGINYTGVKKEDYSEITKVLNHRGPDYSSYYDSDNILLVHNRLSIIDLSTAANQPMIDEETGNVLVFNGEIYNYKELKSEYDKVKWKTNSDSEVILKLYALIGPGFVEKLTGIFAFVIYDIKKHKLLLYRDRFGVKPLYFYKSKDEFIFSSEIKGITFFNRKPKLNYFTIFNYLEQGQLACNEETFFENIFSVKPAHFLEFNIRTKELLETRYWDIPDGNYWFELSEEDAIHKTYSLLEKSIKLNLESDVEVGISLSGGIDSTLLLKLMQKFHCKIKAFTFGFKEEEYDEVKEVRENLTSSEIELFPVYLSKEEMLPCLKEALYYFEMPLGGLGTLSAFNMMKEVRKQGIKVMLSGEGADEVFGGYKYYYPAFFKDIENDGKLLLKELMLYSEAHHLTLKPFSTEYNALLEEVNNQLILAPDGTGALQTHTSENLKNRFNQTIDLKKRYFSSKLKEAMYYDLINKKLPKLLQFQDRASMANSVETRVPFLDHNLVSFIYTLPPVFKIKNGQTKYLLRKVLEDKFNVVNLNKTKHYVATPQREWLKDTKIREEILNIVRKGILVKEDIINFEKFEKDYINYSNNPELGNSFFVWKIINLELLLEKCSETVNNYFTNPGASI